VVATLFTHIKENSKNKCKDQLVVCGLKSTSSWQSFGTPPRELLDEFLHTCLKVDSAHPHYIEIDGRRPALADKDLGRWNRMFWLALPVREHNALAGMGFLTFILLAKARSSLMYARTL
jgi:hypothetical protein